MTYCIRLVRAGEWRRLRELRLTALRDPVSGMAFESTYEREAAFPDRTWQERAAGGSTFVGADQDGSWRGMVTVLVEDGPKYPAPQTHLVGMYVLPEVRGTALAGELVRSALEWSWRRPQTTRARLWVVGENARAVAFYNRLGFTRTGRSGTFAPNPGLTEFEMELPRPR